MTLKEEQLSLQPDAQVELFTVDATILDGPVFRFTPSISEGSGSLTFDGVEYPSVPIEVEGFEVSARGQLPKPTLRVSNVLKTAASAVISYGDLVGSTVTRTRTFRKFLDDGSDPNPNMKFADDIFRVERKTAHNRVFIEWELSAALDQEDRRLPGRRVLRDTCTHRYRVYKDGAFQIQTCPFLGSTFFKSTGEATIDPAEDVCGKKLSDCKLRFGESAQLPFQGFPSVARTR